MSTFNGVRYDLYAARRHDPHGHRQPDADRRQHQHRHGRRPGPDQPGLGVRRRHRHPAIDGAGAQTFTGASTAAAGSLPNVVINKPRARSPWPARSARPTTGRTPRGRSTRARPSSSSLRASRSVAARPWPTSRSTAAPPTTRCPRARRSTVAGALTLTDGNINTGTVAAQGSISQASTFDGGTGTLLINGAGAQTFTGAATTAAGDLPPIQISKPSGTLTLAGTIRTSHNWTYTAGTVDPGTSTVVFAGGTVTRPGARSTTSPATAGRPPSDRP